MEVLQTIDGSSWGEPFPANLRSTACEALETGKILFFPHLAFALETGERELLTPEVSNGISKNVSLKRSGEMGGTSATGDTARRLKAMMGRFAESAARLVESLVPAYSPHLEHGSTSYRPVEIAGRPAKEIHDDTRLHVDAFPSRPTCGRRILRLFSNIHPAGSPRVWRVGEPFEQMARRFLSSAREGSRAEAWLLNRLGITKGVRSPYDGLMLGLHDRAKRDEAYQQQAPQTEIPFPAGSTWICYTDQVMHAATAGQFVLEQTFHLDVAAMATPARCPLRVLERLRGHPLV